jgi:hypothetical protein
MENSFKKSNVTSRTIFTTAAILAVQALPVGLYAQTGVTTKASTKPSNFVKIKYTEIMKVVGIDNGSPVFSNNKGEYFTVNSKTGDLSFIKPEEFSKFTYTIKLNPADLAAKSAARTMDRGSAHIKLANEKVSEVTIVGQDAQGHTLMKNSRGENFYLDPITGDLIFIKI